MVLTQGDVVAATLTTASEVKRSNIHPLTNDIGQDRLDISPTADVGVEEDHTLGAWIVLDPSKAPC